MNIKQTINSFSARTVDRLTSARRATLTMLATFLIAMTAQTAWADNDPIGSISYNSTLGAYEIKNVNNLNDLAVYVNGSGNYSNTGYAESTAHDCEGLTFKMTADIKYNPNAPTIDYDNNGVYESNFTPIGGLNTGFFGTFDGQGYTISGIRIDKSGLSSNDDYIGIFGYVGNTTGAPMVKNLVVSNCSFAGDKNVGVIAGYRRAHGIIENCHVGNDVTVSGNSHVGGIVGESYDFGIIKGCTSAATITGTASGGNNASSLGGIVGYSSKTGNIYIEYRLTDNIFTGSITGSSYVGAIVGEFEDGNTDVLLTNNLYTSSVIKGIGASASTIGTDGYGAKRAYTITGGEKVTVDFAGDATTTYSPNGISVYGAEIAGMKYANTLYVDGTAAVNVLLSSDDPVNSYSASAGTLTGTAITGSKDAYTLAMANPVSNITITADFALWGEKDGADGSEAKPYTISTTAGLDKLAQRVNAGNDAVVNGFSGKYFKLGDNIAYDKNTANNFTPIGDNNHIFYGTFDGDGKTISGININSGGAEYQGIFGYVSGTVKNLVVSNCSIVAYQKIGAIAGILHGTIENCHVGNDVTLSSGSSYAYAGGIVGSCERGTIKGCTCAATITGTNNAGDCVLGGIVGATTEYASTSSKLTDNIFTGRITGNLGDYIGAIVGQNNSGTLLTNNVYTSTGFGGIGKAGSTTGEDGAGARKALTISAATDVTITPTGNATTYNVSGITTYADNNVLGYDSKLYAGATDAVKLSIANTGTPETGYEFSGFTAGEGVTITSSENVYTLTVPASDVTVDVVNQAIIYNITYKGVEDEGVTFTEDNPEAYTVADESFTLNNPSKEDYVFTGWTYEGQTTPTTSVTIATGSTGDKTFTANWRSMEEPNPAVVNVEETPVAIGGEVYYQPTEDVKQIFKGDNASFAISAEASNRMEVTAEGSVKFSKGPSTTIALPKLTVGAKMRVDFYGQVKVKDTEVRRNSIYTRGRGDSSSDGMIDLVSGAEYEVLTDDPLVLTIVLEEEEAVIEGITVTEPEPSDGSIVVTAKNKYWTFSSDKDVKVPAGVKVYTCQLNSDQTAVVITNITSKLGGVIKAGNGVLLSSAAGEYTFVPSTETTSETKTYENNLLEPVLKATNFASGEYYVLKDNEFHPILANDSNVPANKAVLRVAKKSAARLEIIGDDDVKTAINGIAVEEDGAEWYTISGQRIDKPTKKGLYIKNGKKVIIK